MNSPSSPPPPPPPADTPRRLTRKVAIPLLALCVLAAGLILTSTATANAQMDDGAVARCSSYHRFGAQPVDIVKTSDLSRVLAQAHWGWSTQGGFCYLTLDDAAIEVLRANADRLPDPVVATVDDTATDRCSEYHRFGAQPVDIAKTTDLSRVLARASWGYTSGICYLTLDAAAIGILRANTGSPVSAERIASIVQDLRSHRQERAVSLESTSRVSCPESPVPDDTSGMAEILLIVNGCLVFKYEPLNGRSLADIRDLHRDDPTFISVDLPLGPISVDTPSGNSFLDASFSQTDSSGWHLNAVSANRLRQFNWPSDTAIGVAVIDDGVDSTHAELSGRVENGSGGPSDDGEPSNVSHGTHVAGIIAGQTIGIAPEAKIRPFNVDDENVLRELDGSEILAALADLTNNSGNVRVVNMSFGVINENCNSNYSNLIQLLEDLGIVSVAAGGNEAANSTSSPANCQNVIGVSATNQSGQFALDYACGNLGSSLGSHIDVAAPGDCIRSSIVGGYDTWSGTSMAAPVVSAIVAHLFARCPSATPSDIRKSLEQTADYPSPKAEELESYTDEDMYGRGIIDPLGAIDYLYENYENTCERPKNQDRGVRLSIGRDASTYCGSHRDRADCRWLKIELTGSGWNRNETYHTQCRHDGENAPWPAGTWVSDYATFTNGLNENRCWYGIAGSTLQVTVDSIHSNEILWTSASDDPPPSSGDEVRLSVGPDARGSGGCSSVHCKWLDIELAGRGWNLDSSYRVQCGNNGVWQLNSSPGIWKTVTTPFSNGRNTINRDKDTHCFFGYPGNEVYVVINGIKSNTITWPEGTSELPPPPDDPPPSSGDEVRLSVGPDARGSGGCSSVHCKWLDIELAGRGWNLDSSYRVQCGNNGVWQLNSSPGIWKTVTTPFSNGRNTINRDKDTHCFFGYPGNEVYVVINGIKSNTITWPEGT